MDAFDLIAELSQPAAYPLPVAAIELHQTHISLVFLAGDFAYKIKKPVSLGFLDFSTLERRKHFCEEEVRLNRRLAPSVYLGVVPITQEQSGLKMEGSGEPIEWAVKMVRLPPENTLEQRIESGQVRESELDALAEVIARFHRTTATSAEIASFGKFEVIARNARENFEQSRPEIGVTVHADVFEQLRSLTEEQLTWLHSLIDARAARGVPRDTHGDLHLDHVYHFPERPPPEDWVIVDCIEFNERFRYADSVADAAFLVMDLKFHGRPDLARAFADAYFQKANDEEGRALLSFYVAYRSIVRAKVGGIKLRGPEVGKRERSIELLRAQAHWLLALNEMAEPTRRPCLLLIGGLPGTGKSTLARLLAERHGFNVIRSDVVRKSMRPEDGNVDLYSLEAIDRTYLECLTQAKELLFAGKRVIVDATFRADKHRLMFLQGARDWCVPAHWFECQATRDQALERIAARKNDASDATRDVYKLQAARWDAPSEKTRPIRHAVDTDFTLENAFQQIERVLHAVDLL